MVGLISSMLLIGCSMAQVESIASDGETPTKDAATESWLDSGAPDSLLEKGDFPSVSWRT